MALVITNICAFCEVEIDEVISPEALENYDHGTPSCCDACAGIEKETTQAL